jgi:RecJ-like exonuclease
MKIGTIRPRISLITIVVVVIFTIFLVYAYILNPDPRLLLWGIPTLVLILLIPLCLNYLSQQQYADVRPQYESEARPVRIKLINLNMVGDPVRIEGVVEKVRFQSLNRPQYMVADRSGEISVRMFTQPGVTVKQGDVVEVLGMVIRKYIMIGDAVINGVSIRKIDKIIETKKKEAKKP